MQHDINNARFSVFIAADKPTENDYYDHFTEKWMKVHKPHGSNLLHTIIDAIQSGRWQRKIEHLRTLHKEAYDIAKKDLPCFTPSGFFAKRNLQGLVSYTGIICIDIDTLSEQELDFLRDELKSDPFTLALFVSPSGKGLKVFYWHRQRPKHHKDIFRDLQATFKKFYNIAIDAHCSDITRLCFVSYDPEAYYNENAQPLSESDKNNEPAATFADVVIEDMEAGKGKLADLKTLLIPENTARAISNFTKLNPYWKKNGITPGYYGGNRNQWLYLLACNCNRYGLAIEETTDLCRTYYDTDNEGIEWSEIARTIESAYRNTWEHGQYKVPQ